jgi:hypothetical protein
MQTPNMQEKMRAAAEQEARRESNQAATGQVGPDRSSPLFTERLYEATARDRRAAERACVRQELIARLEAAPEIARILDLIDALGQ